MFLASKLLKPKYRCGRPDPIMERVVRVRAWLGLTVVFGVFLRVFYENNARNPYQGTSPGSGATNPAVPSMPSVPTNLGMPGTPSIDAMANLPMPQATGLPTGLPTGFDFPTNLPTGYGTGLPTNLPTGLGTNFPTAVPTAGSGGSSGLDASVNHATQSLHTISSAVSVGQEIAGAVIDRIVIAPVMCALGIVLIGLLLTLFAAPHARTATIHQLRHPIRTIILFALVTAGGIGAYLGLHAGAGLRHKTIMINDEGTALQLILSWASAFVLLWTVLFAIGALWQVTRHLFAAIDGHPLLPAMLAIWLAWTLVFNDIALHAGGQMVPLSGAFDSQDTVPDNVKAAIGILGATLVTVLALWEIARINKWNGINFRTGPFGNRP
ncbi:PT domain-containing protein [Yinghuangia sp. ASG 101]|uniref:PT domain-containing protein n=1 Tax=Yinghuangia sp. ASG 101 TaxID=2896848 RepID=UPI001E3D076D|nr:PT domain-containing protein [Yinghuangia sp. ASG 101]UGQ14919.1 PT domain-containing protein [Yinghuangia sp. ASG 101]